MRAASSWYEPPDVFRHGQEVTIGEETGMNRLLGFMLSVSFTAALTTVAGIATSTAQDLAVTNPAEVKVLVDNDRVRILEVLHKPGAKEPIHSHPAYVAVFLSATRLKVTLPDGKVVEKDRKAGEVQYSEPVTHSVDNVGTTDQHVIVVELKK
jgi:quercetin dioxygenase-like cupin family protein